MRDPYALTDTARRRRACIHRLRELPRGERPWRYRCAACGQKQKQANGVNLDALDRLTASRRGAR